MVTPVRWLALFLLILGAGCLLVLPLVRRKEIGSGFFHLNIVLGLALILLGALMGAAGQLGAIRGWFETVPWGIAAFLGTSAVVLGAGLVAMILGHWYLVSPLSFDLLARFSKVLILALAARLLAVGWNVWANHGGQWVSGGLPTFDGLIVGFRFGVGIVLPVIFTLMALQCAKVRSNRSATGILYVVLVCILLGELASWHLTFDRGALV